jgi:UDP-3-O-[3-hydroxymyristoyl] N-acetylglucosamine deacetylase
MTLNWQHTLKLPINCTGVGIHSGKTIRMRILPAAENAGICFVRTDLKDNNCITATYDNVVDTLMCTVIANQHGAKVAVVEHLMSALWGCGIDNAIIEVDDAEVPVMDGSAAPFVALIRKAGVLAQSQPRKFVEILSPIKIEHQGKIIELLPNDSFEVDFHIDFEHPNIGSQHFVFNEEQNLFSHDISRARTFGFIEDVQKLQSMGLARGASLENAVGLSREGGILNVEGLRFDKEFVKHKILDCIGDLYLAGARIKGKVVALKAGHMMNNLILRKLFAEKDAYRLIDYGFPSQPMNCSLNNPIYADA